VSYPTAKKKTKKGSVLLRLARGAKVAGLGRAQLHDGRASVTLRTRGSVDAGRWLVTVVRLGAHGGAQTTTLTVRLP
jgi:hypothetical protein